MANDKPKVRVTEQANIDANATAEAIELANSQDPPINLSAIDGEGKDGQVLIGQVRDEIAKREAKAESVTASADVRKGETEDPDAPQEVTTPPPPATSESFPAPSRAEDPNIREKRNTENEAKGIKRAAETDGETEERYAVMLSPRSSFTASGIVAPYKKKDGQQVTVRVSTRHYEYLTLDQLEAVYDYATANYDLDESDFLVKRTGRKASSPSVTSKATKTQDVVSSKNVGRNVPVA